MDQSVQHNSKMNLFILLLFLPFAFGDILEPNALPMRKCDFLETNALSMKGYDFLEPTKRYDILTNITFSDLVWPMEEKPVLVCNLVCQNVQWYELDLWICKWRMAEISCLNVTREIMKNAETIYPEMPYLINASSSSKFSIGFDGNMGRVSSFEDGFLSDYSHLYAFFAKHNPIKKISKGMFEGVRGMKAVMIFKCPFLSKIERGSFQNMTSLEELDLDDLNLSIIDRNMFEGLHSLKHMGLSGNIISRIEANTFTHLHSLRMLFLDENNISYIHKDAFKGFKGYWIALDSNLISFSDLNSIRNLPGLYQFFVMKNRISSISSDIFKNLQALCRVYLHHNPISSIPTGIFNHSYNLHDIEVGCGEYEPPQYSTNLTLERESFATKTRLMQVVIRGCVTEIKPSAFKGLKTVKLSLQSNSKLKRIKRIFFEGIKGLSVLSLGGNGAEIVESDTFCDPSFKNLLTLSLAYNKLQTIEPHTFRNLTKLTNLYLSGNMISTISHNIFEGLQSLTHLQLEYNSISKIEERAFSSLGSLESLNVSHNHISSLSRMYFKGLEALKHLDISYNNIEEISSDDVFYDLYNLETLLLQGNGILKIEPQGTLWLELLDLSQNHLTTLEIFHDQNVFSKKIILSKNKLTKIDKLDIAKTAVTELLLDYNKISDVAFIPDTVNHLDLSHNEIEKVSITEIELLQKIDIVHIDHNPWNCSCRESDRPLMNFLHKLDIIPCCPKDCKCLQTKKKSVDVNCHSKNKSALPTCLPFELVKLDYSKNILPNLTITSSHENVTYLDLNQNLLTMINGSSFTLLRNLTYLDLRSNILEKVPHQFESLKATKIFLEGNHFLCNDCDLVNTLEIVDQVTPQHFNCKDKQHFQNASLICFLKFRIAPYVTLSVGIIALISGLYLIYNKLYMKRLSKRYEHRFVLLRSKNDVQAYKRECEILLDLDHLNVQKMYKTMITRIPKWAGHFYLEKVDCSLRKTLQDISSGSACHASLNEPELTRQLMAGMQFLHSRNNPIFIRNLSIDSILLKLDSAATSWILKLGDFSQAIVHIPTQITDEEAPLTTSSDDEIAMMQDDLQAAAHIVYFLLTHQEKEEPITMQDLKDEPDIEMSILILSLQNGITASEALLTAPFQLMEQRVLMLGELNALFKGVKNTKGKLLRDAEENSHLVIGGKGAWNKYFDLSLLKDFALLFNGYNIISYVDLLRIIRNILQHGPESPSSMLAAFGTKTPTPKQILLHFSECFPFFYLHSIYCLYKLFDKSDSSGSDTYMKTYREFEDYLCGYGVSTGAILPLQEKSKVSIHYQAPYDELHETFIVEGTRSCIYLKDFLPQIYEKSQNLWPDVSSKELFFKNQGKEVPNPSLSADPTEPIIIPDKLCIPEGSSFQVLKPEVMIQLPEQVVVKRFKKTDNVKSLRGFSFKFLPPATRKKEKLKSIMLTFDSKQLKDSQRIFDLDFADHPFIVKVS